MDAPLNPPVVFASTYIGMHDTVPPRSDYGRYGQPDLACSEEAIGALRVRAHWPLPRVWRRHVPCWNSYRRVVSS